MPVLRRARWAARVAAGLACASAAVSLYWTAGGTLLLDTVGGAIEDLARERSLGAVAVGTATVVVKAAAGVLALALVHLPRGVLARLEQEVARGAQALGGAPGMQHGLGHLASHGSAGPRPSHRSAERVNGEDGAVADAHAPAAAAAIRSSMVS